ncbi:hypothetical protein K437DRAFT_295460 [Tilletiaria anomala UBC 951]|uniref:Uncharacterized protein n=1 Tax=Tilletiaria anomala (strain ATCC 24038 / CBS 436.72 / UBC 951) TaxID=1037660 RepID=A0A066VJR7_TILAU|nr:uncharacterized protein K437DRAFT_295460 [Tilletiaria anomala UBC 951]KDN41967.1 hypothetical protein K437DRAFT_295460 [Tilletiaria anomala UBC 951]
MLSSKFTLLVPLALASVAGAVPQTNPFGSLGQIINGLSPGCVGAIGGFVLNPTDPLALCLSLSNALQTFTAAGQNSSLVPAFNSYLTQDICGKPACSADALAKGNATLNTACSDSDRAANNGTNAAVLFQELLTSYYPIRNAVCNENTKSGTNCVVETMYGIQNATGQTLSLSTLVGLLSEPEKALQLERVLLSNNTVLCTDCNKALISSILKTEDTSSSQAISAASSNSPSQLIGGVEKQCGASFLNGQFPNDTKNSSITASSSSGSNSSQGGSNGASVAVSGSGAAALFGFVAAGAALLA